MTAPSTYLREKREAAAQRRLELSKLLRDDPKATNITLAKALGVTRDTIALDRKIMVEELHKQTLTETELLRAEMVGKLEHLNEELELHRKDGKLPVSVIHEMMLVNRSIIELLGVRKPVVEQLEVKKRTTTFQVVIAGRRTNDGTALPDSEPQTFEMTRELLALTQGGQE